MLPYALRVHRKTKKKKKKKKTQKKQQQQHTTHLRSLEIVLFSFRCMVSEMSK